MTTCASCGYPRHDHDADSRCPVCACGLTPEQHEQTAEALLCTCGCEVPAFMHASPDVRCWLCDARMPHACIYATYLGAPCPGRRSEAEKSAGQWLALRLGTFKPADELPPETALWRDILRRDTAARHAAADAARAEHVHTPVPAPRIPARPPHDLSEVAAGQGRQARGLGRKAVAAGWSASAYYWVAGDGTEGSAVRLQKGDLRGVAVWTREPGAKGWKSDVAYGWRIGSGLVPQKITVTKLEGWL